MNANAARRFQEATTLTLSPQQLVMMCFERIDRDLQGVVQALKAGDLSTANELSCHAQDIIAELLGSVDDSAWEHAGRLISIYTWSLTELLEANIHKDLRRVEGVRRNLEALGSAFRTALTTPSGATPS